MEDSEFPGEPQDDDSLCTLTLLVPEDLYRAFQRCLWIQVHETGKSNVEIMAEFIRSYLTEQGC